MTELAHVQLRISVMDTDDGDIVRVVREWPSGHHAELFFVPMTARGPLPQKLARAVMDGLREQL